VQGVTDVINQQPDAVDDPVTTDEDTPLGGSVLDNDSVRMAIR
jgi:hypothetical protein